MATIKMISERCGLSVAAVSKALNGQPGISREKAELVRRVAREMGYFPNAAARTLKTNRSYNIGVVFQNCLTHELFSAVLDAARQEAGRQGYDISFLGNQDRTASVGYYEQAKIRQCDGVLIVEGDFQSESVQQLVASDVPVVVIGYIYPGRTSILNDNVGSMEEIVHYLHELGHTRLAFIHGEDSDVTRQRLAGFYRGCQEVGIQVPGEYVLPARYHKAQDAGLATRKLLACPQRPTCILYPDDFSYLGGLSEIQRQGLSVPGDISCFGYDGIELAGNLCPQLATYNQDAESMGRQAAAQLIDAIERPQTFVSQMITVTGRIQPGETVRDLRK